MEKDIKVLFICNIGSKTNEPNGVTIKNAHLKKYLVEKSYALSIINTEKWKTNFPVLFVKILWFSLFSKKIIISINSKSANMLIRVLNIFGLSKKVIYIVVGGNLHNMIKSNRFKAKHYAKLIKIFVQSKTMVEQMQGYGLNNVEYLPNSKYFDPIVVNYYRKSTRPLRFFYLGRVDPDKGIDLVIDALNIVNKTSVSVSLDIFGPISKNYKQTFMRRIDVISFVRYLGPIDLSNSDNYRLLSNYDMMVFPSFWKGEGFPGVILDAFISGVPTLASDWNHNSDLIHSGYNGLLFISKDIDSLVKSILHIIGNPKVLYSMRKNAHSDSKQFHSENVLKKIDNCIVNH